MNRCLKVLSVALLCHAGATSAIAQSIAPASSAQQTLAGAAAERKYTFLVFYRDNGQATQAMAQTVRRGVDSRKDRATVAYVNVANSAEKALVARFDVSRAPMPLTIAVAPNGAITSIAPGKITDEEIGASFVTPAAAQCMKSMQDGKIVLACVQSTEKPAMPQGVKDFCDDPFFKDRTAVMFIHARDPAEAEFLEQMEINPRTQGSMTVFLAPPGVLVGKFGPAATKDQLAAALHQAGKCCDDVNCKHNQSQQPR
jgi:hypothetical protein